MEELIKEIKEFIVDMTNINNEMIIKIIYQSLVSSTILGMYLQQNGVIKSDFDNFMESNNEKVSKYLMEQAEKLIKSKKEEK